MCTADGRLLKGVVIVVAAALSVRIMARFEKSVAEL
jgi:hypothetical protein